MPLRAWLREVIASSRAQRVTSAVTLLFVLGSTTAVLVTAGRAEGSQAAILAEVDAVGTRTLTVRVSPAQDEFTADLVDRLAAYGDVIDRVTGFGPVTDVVATAGGTPVAMRTVYGPLGEQALAPLGSVQGVPQALATADAMSALGLLSGRGTVYDAEGRETLITGEVTMPDDLASLSPAVLVPGHTGTKEPLVMITVVAHRPADLPLVTTLVTDALGDIDPSTVTIETSQQLAELRAVLEGKLTRQGHTVVLGILVGSALVIMINVWSLALTRRKDFGRRRALGATRAMILGLLTGQVAVLASIGALVGVGVGAVVLAAAGDPLPPVEYLLAVATAFVLAAVVTAFVPALWAANRDPLTELRVP